MMQAQTIDPRFTQFQPQDPRLQLSAIPNYHQALALESVHADQISEQEFQRRYVSQNRPVHLIGAARHWPAFARWGSIDYLKQTVPNVRIPARTAPNSEYDPMAAPALRASLRERNQAIFSDIGFHEFLDRVSSCPGQLVLQGATLQKGLPLGELCDDLGGYSVLPQPGGARMYAPYRTFFYRESYTDWHYHPTDETLMTQVVGDKEVLLFPPDRQSWRALWPVAYENGYLFDIDTVKYPHILDLKPVRVVVRAGDALYIPVYWWHVVAPLAPDFGVTVAATFKTPLHINGDVRYPAARAMLQRRIRTRHAPLILAAVAWSYLHRGIVRHFI